MQPCVATSSPLAQAGCVRLYVSVLCWHCEVTGCARPVPWHASQHAQGGACHGHQLRRLCNAQDTAVRDPIWFGSFYSVLVFNEKHCVALCVLSMANRHKKQALRRLGDARLVVSVVWDVLHQLLPHDGKGANEGPQLQLL